MNLKREEEIKARIRLIKLLKAAVYQSEKLNDQLDEMHDILMSNRHAQKAA